MLFNRFLLICAVLFSLGWVFVLSKSKKPHNQYELLIYQDHFEVKDGERKVGSFTWEQNRKLDSLILKDNL